jgi:bacterioferritin-associated ferredoxin
MILCSCNVLTQANIEAAAQVLAETFPGRPVTPAGVFKVLGYRPRCGTCFELVRRLLRDMEMPLTCPEPLDAAAELEVQTTMVVEETVIVEETLLVLAK